MDAAADESANCGLGIHCVRCGYDLRATPRAGLCPECRETCEASLWIRTAAGQRWRRRMYWGAHWLAVAMAARIVPGLGFTLVGWLGYRFNYTVYYWCEWVQWWMVPLSVGALLITTPFAPDRGRQRWAVPSRLVARWIVLLWALQEVAAPLLYLALTYNGVEGGSSELMLMPGWERVFAISEWIYGPVWMTGLLGLLSHVFIIAARLRRRRLLVQLRTLTVILAVWTMAFYNIDALGDWVIRWGTPALVSTFGLVKSYMHNTSWWVETLLELWAAVLMLWLARMYSTPLPEQSLACV